LAGLVNPAHEAIWEWIDDDDLDLNGSAIGRGDNFRPWLARGVENA